MKVYDFRSDTVTLPTPEMMAAVAAAPLGDSARGDDPTVNELEQLAAKLTGKDDALFVPSGTMANLAAVIAHECRGGEVIVEESAHIYNSEGGGLSAAAGAIPRPVKGEYGVLDPYDVKAVLRGTADQALAPTRLICLENTHNASGGAVIPLECLAAIHAIAGRAGVPLHLDGARLFNAAAYMDVPVADICRHADSVWFALCKGLGAPVGAILAGSRAFMGRARRAAKMLGGAMRQAGLIAAPAIVALKDPYPVHKRDHRLAHRLASRLAGIDETLVDVRRVQTNIVNCFVDRFADDAAEINRGLRERGILANAKRSKIRFVTHYHLDEAAVDAAADAFADVLRTSPEERPIAMNFKKEPPVFFAGEELHRVKQQKVQQALAQSDFDAFMFFKAEAVRYITDFYVKGFRPFMEPEYMVLVARGKPPAVGYISGSDDLRIRFKSDIEDARRLPPVARWAETIGGMLSDYGLGAGRIGTDLMPYMVYEGLKRQFPGLQIADAGKVWAKLTAIKHPAEIELIRNAVRIADLGAKAAMDAIRPGIREQEVSAEAVYAMRKAGSEFEPFIPLVGSGYNTSMFERVATDKVIRSGEMVILDIGAVYRGYTGDLGRTVICGEPTPEQRAVYKATYAALDEAKKIIKPGVTCHQIDRRARDVIEDAGWGKYLYSGNTGHQLGYGLHGDPLVDKNVDFAVVENMVMCLEPRIVLPDRPEVGGAHLEDVVVVTAGGHEKINRTPFDERLLA